ncbi:hypothetical protein FRC17_010031 [Serendipita sp. 399]|nr:hypothetical protein FRC17_010031 [Serendipita sp. 399]
MQETRLSKLLVKVLSELGFSQAETRALGSWSEGGGVNGLWKGRAGSLGEDLKNVLSSRNRNLSSTSTIHDIDDLLDELSEHSKYSQTHVIVDAPRLRLNILRDLYAKATPKAANLITQIILKDLRPILEPIGVAHTTLNLLKKNSHLQRLTLKQSLKAWDRRLPELYRVCASLKEAFNALEHGTNTSLSPVVGVPVETAERVYCETKYDGERMQIHVDLSLPFSQQITIFSKSKRDSTADRSATHEIIRTALGIPEEQCHQPFLKERRDSVQLQKGFQSTVVLEAEMVPFSERTRTIDEFWRIRDLIAATAQGPRRRFNKAQPKPSPIFQDSLDSNGEPTEPLAFPSPEYGHSLDSNGTDEGHRHFMLVFFDILYIDGRNLLEEIYTVRREILQDVVNTVEGFSKLASRTPIWMQKGDPVRSLQSILSTSISQFEEGLVLKANASTYGSRNLLWVKLKRDYIPGFGDCIDMAVIGVMWEKERARELAVGTDTFTTFFAAALTKETWEEHELPHLEVLFTVSYGLTKERLERLNFDIKAQSPVPFKMRKSLSYSFNLSPGIETPSFLFHKPMLFELFGAGFDKPAQSKYYAIRWSRVSKICRPEERPWTEGETIVSYTSKAYAAVGRDSSEKKAKVQVAGMWKVSPGVSPQARSLRNRTSIERNLLERLKDLEPTGRRNKSTREAAFRHSRDFPATMKKSDLATKESFPNPLGLLVAEGYDSESSQSPRKRRRLGRADCSSSLHYEVNKDVPVDENLELTEILIAPISLQVPSSPLLAISPVRNSPEPPSADTENKTESSDGEERRLSFDFILTDSFILVYRPMYPIPKRRRGRPAIKSVLPPHRLLSTLDALLVGLGWYERHMPPSNGVKRGVVFAEPSDLESARDQLRSQKQELGERLSQLPEIFVVSKHYLDIYLDANGSVLPSDYYITVFWRSHQ